MRLRLLFLLAILLGLSVGIMADEPLPPPADYSISSANGKYKAFFDAEDKTTIVYKTERKKKKKLWEMAGWYRNTFLANDGSHLVVAYDGANLLNLDYKPDQVMLSFYENGNLLQKIRLDQLLQKPFPANLERTESHYKWVESYGLNTQQIFEVNTIEKKQFLFDIKTGKPIKGELFSPSNKAVAETTSPATNQGESPTNQNTAETKPAKGTCSAAFFIACVAFLSIFNGRQA